MSVAGTMQEGFVGIMGTTESEKPSTLNRGWSCQIKEIRKEDCTCVGQVSGSKSQIQRHLISMFNMIPMSRDLHPTLLTIRPRAHREEYPPPLRGCPQLMMMMR